MDVLKSYLVQNKSINIPGLGTVYMETVPAQSDFVNKQLLPPHYVYRFDKYFDAPDKEFFSYLSSRKKIPDYEAIKWYNELAYNIRSDIRNKEEAVWGEIGIFKKDEAGEIVFEETALHLPLFSPVPAERVVRTNASHHMWVGDRETTTTQMSELLQEEVYVEKEAWWIYALILAAVGLCISFFHYYRYGMNIGSLFN